MIPRCRPNATMGFHRRVYSLCLSVADTQPTQFLFPNKSNTFWHNYGQIKTLHSVMHNSQIAEKKTSRAETIDYRCDDSRFWLSAHDCQVPTSTSQNLELEQQIRIFIEQTNSSIAWKMEIQNSWATKKANSEKLGLGIDNPWRIVFFKFAHEQVLVAGRWPTFFGILELSAMQCYQDVAPIQQFFFFFFPFNLQIGQTARTTSACTSVAPRRLPRRRRPRSATSTSRLRRTCETQDEPLVATTTSESSSSRRNQSTRGTLWQNVFVWFRPTGNLVLFAGRVKTPSLYRKSL